MKHLYAIVISAILGLAGIAVLVLLMTGNSLIPSKTGSTTGVKTTRMPGPTLLAMMADHQFNKLHDPLLGEIPPVSWDGNWLLLNPFRHITLPEDNPGPGAGRGTSEAGCCASR